MLHYCIHILGVQSPTDTESSYTEADKANEVTINESSKFLLGILMCSYHIIL